jgi:hypothetical protein
MAISLAGTFDYIFDVEADIRRAALKGRLRDPAKNPSKRLVGHAPILAAVEYQPQSWQLYARLTLTASDPHNASIAQASFSIDRGLLNVLRRGDELHLGRTSSGGIALSMLRQRSLIAAAGAITAVPLGDDAAARLPLDLVREAETLFRIHDVAYEMHDIPLEISVAGLKRILHRGRLQMGPYEVCVRHGCDRDEGARDVSASIERRGVCPVTAAETTAQLFDQEGVQLSTE